MGGSKAAFQTWRRKRIVCHAFRITGARWFALAEGEIEIDLYFVQKNHNRCSVL